VLGVDACQQGIGAAQGMKWESHTKRRRDKAHKIIDAQLSSCATIRHSGPGVIEVAHC
jgi:hypothetical protein